MQVLTHEEMSRQINEIASRGQHVTVDLDRLAEIGTIMSAQIEREWWRAFRETPEHYQFSPLRQGDADAIMFYLLNSSQMWLIWERLPDGTVRPWQLKVGDDWYVGASGITAAHYRALTQDRRFLDPTQLAAMTLEDVRALYRDEETDQTTLQNLPGRLAKFNEIGRVLQSEFDGQATRLLERAGGYLFKPDGEGLIQLLVRYFPVSFGDWPFCKLPIIVVLSLWGMRESDLPQTEEFRRLAVFHDLDSLEGGADYYRPLFLMRLGVLRPSDPLRARLSQNQLIERDSPEEQEIRATTLQVLRTLTHQLGTFPDDLPGVEIETHAMAFLKCRHCTPDMPNDELYCPYHAVCEAHNGDQRAMQLGWPLVLTTAY